MKLYNAWYCPFAQRAWMALVHKGIDFEYVEVDPYNKTDWWVKVSRGAELVPVLVKANSDGDGETTIVESNRILEFLEDYRPQQNPIFARDPVERAEQKYWMDHIGNRITPYLYRFLKSSEAGEHRDESRENLVAGLDTFIRAMSDSGPFFSGAEVGAVDIALIPFAYRIDVLLKAYRDFELPAEGEIWQRYQRWYNTMLDLPAFKTTAFDQGEYEQRLVEHYYPYSLGEGQTDVTRVK
jgi:glutathione S-transferase